MRWAAWAVLWFFVSWRTSQNSTTLTLSHAIAVSWMLWLLTWLAFSRWSGHKVDVTPSTEQLRYRITETVGMLLIAFGGMNSGRLYVVTPTIASIALAIVVTGHVFMVWARVHLGRNWSVDVSVKSDHQIIRSGPYAITRHPIYTGLLTAFLGTAIFRGTILAVVGFALTVIAFHLKLTQEEELLGRHFGDDYSRYQREVKKLVPLIW